MTSQNRIDTYKPSNELVHCAKMYEEFLGKETVDMAYKLSIIDSILSKNKTRPHLFIQLLKTFFVSITSQDPNRFHFEIARKVLGITGDDHNDEAVLFLAKALCDGFRTLEERLKLPEVLLQEKRLSEECDAGTSRKYCLDFIDFPDAPEEFDLQFFESNGLSIWDNKFLKLLRSFGTEGKKRAKEFTEKLKESKSRWSKNLWFKNSGPSLGIDFFHSMAIMLLGCVLWKDGVKQRWNLKEKNLPALTTSVQTPVIKIWTFDKSSGSALITCQKSSIMPNGENS